MLGSRAASAGERHAEPGTSIGSGGPDFCPGTRDRASPVHSCVLLAVIRVDRGNGIASFIEERERADDEIAGAARNVPGTAPREVTLPTTGESRSARLGFLQVGLQDVEIDNAVASAPTFSPSGAVWFLAQTISLLIVLRILVPRLKVRPETRKPVHLQS
jgi:hypothetical protein